MKKLPKNILKLFWGDDLKDLDWGKHKDYIAKTILSKGDTGEIKWLFENAQKSYLKTLIKENKLDEKSKNFWNIYFS